MNTRQIKKYILQGRRGAKMVTQAREDITVALAGYQSSQLFGLDYPLCVLGGIWPFVLHLHHADCKSAKVLVQSKNLFRLKGSLGPCLDDANTLQNLLFLADYYLYYALI